MGRGQGEGGEGRARPWKKEKENSRADGTGSRLPRVKRVNSLLRTRSRAGARRTCGSGDGRSGEQRPGPLADLATNLFPRRAKTEDTPCRVMN